MNLSHAEARSRVLEEKYEEALPAAHLSLRCANELYGPDAVELVPVYLLLAKANMGKPTQMIFLHLKKVIN